MSLSVTPGPLPGDGSRLNVDLDLRAFVNGTTIAGYGPEAFVGSQATFIFAGTDPPATGSRQYGMRWFKRGEGNLYMWDVLSALSGVTEGFWRAIGGSRKDQIVQIEQGTIRPGDILWPPTRVVQQKNYHFDIGASAQRYLLEMAPTGVTARWNPHPPFLVAIDTALSGQRTRMAEIGIVDFNTMPGATGPGVGCHGGTNFDWRLMQFAQPLTYSNAIIAHITQSNSSGLSVMRGFLWGCPSHLTK